MQETNGCAYAQRSLQLDLGSRDKGTESGRKNMGKKQNYGKEREERERRRKKERYRAETAVV